MAFIYEYNYHGQGFDFEQALHWFKEANRLGLNSKRDITRLEEIVKDSTLSADELYEKGYNYFTGKNGVAESDANAIKFFRLASIKKHKEAMYYLGYMLLCGYGCDFNYKDATTYIKEAIKLGDTRGNYLLGRLYLFGEHYRKNEAKALEYFMLNEDNPNTCYYLGRMYENGLGIKVDLEKAKQYYKIASEKNSYAKKSYDVLMGTDTYETFKEQPYESEVYDAMHGDYNKYPHPILVDLMVEHKIAHDCTGRFNDGYNAERFYREMGRMHDWKEYQKEE